MPKSDNIADIGRVLHAVQMTEKEHRLLGALAWMCELYLANASGFLDHQCMGAGQDAVEILNEYGLIDEVSVRGGNWNEKGRALLDRTA